jgi:hypothetical protein
MTLTEMAGVLALVVSIVSAVIALQAKQLAGKAATLGSRNEAIRHLRDAASDIVKTGVTDEVLEDLREAKALADVVFSREVKSDLDHALEEAERISTTPVPPFTMRETAWRPFEGKLETLIERMKQEARL